MSASPAADRDPPAAEQIGLATAMRELFRFMSPTRRREALLVFALMLLGAFAELVAIGAVLPFLALLADPSALDRFAIVGRLLRFIGADSRSEQLLAVTVLFMLAAIAAGALRLQLAWWSQRFVLRVGHELAVEIQRRILLQPYSFHVSRNTSQIVASLEKVQVLVFNVLLQLMQAATAVFISLFIVAALISVDPFTALIAAAGFASLYVVVSLATQKRLARNSAAIGAAYDERVQLIQESLGGIRDVIIDSSQGVYVDAFRKIDLRLARAKATTAFIGAAPRFVIEAAGMVLIAGIALLIWDRQGGIAGALPILGALALGAQRLLPLVQQIYYGWTSLAGNRSVVGQVLALLRLPVPDDADRGPGMAPLPLRSRIRVENVTFVYQGRDRPALHEVSLAIPRNARVALVGRTGSGKSTLADLLMGLLEPSSGRILVDDVPLTAETRPRWQKSIAHVPQAIFLADTSIARNIAFSVPTDAIDMERVVRAARIAQLDEFVASLPDGYATLVGERGVRISGGQRQRLGLARAIYKDAPVLVLDEATSALDDETEAAVMSALEQLGEEGRTIIMIAHRLTTVAGCDIVARLVNGAVAEIGTYESVIAAPAARKLAR